MIGGSDMLSSACICAAARGRMLIHQVADSAVGCTAACRACNWLTNHTCSLSVFYILQAYLAKWTWST